MMIVTGFTQRRGQKEEDVYVSALDHKHCITCVLRSCNIPVDNTNACPLIDCPRGCPGRYHSCKEEEHCLLCPEERTACINKTYGCSLQLPRKKLLRHLTSCPASVIYCSAEWNRNSLEPAKAGEKPSLVMKKTYIDCGQLDTALAMRDHRVLVDMLLAPRRTLRIFQNPLTKTYPAAPLGPLSSCSADSDGGVACNLKDASEDEEDRKWESTRSWLQMQNELREKKTKLYDISLDTATSQPSAVTSDPTVVHQPDSHVSESIGMTGQPDSVTADSIGVLSSRPTLSSACDDGIASVSKDTSAVSSQGQSHTVAGHSQGQSQEEEQASPGSATDHRRGSADGSTTGADSQRSSSEREGSVGDKQHTVIHDGEALRSILSVGLGVECIARYQPKLPNTYTFLCAQHVRRDQFSQHFQSVHTRIHCHLNGWLEQRCPLAYLGCPFSFQRLKPLGAGVTLCHSWLQESFGVTTLDPQVDPRLQTPTHLDPVGPVTADTVAGSSATSHNHLSAVGSDQRRQSPQGRQVIYTGTQGNSCVRVDARTSGLGCTTPGIVMETAHGLHLSDLPLEVLRHMTQFLDSFSLNNLSLVSRTMRQVCCSVLQDRGVVSLIWERQAEGGQSGWQVIGKRWSFSSCFEAVKDWSFTGHNPISQHLLTCPYNQDRVQHSDRFSIIPVKQTPLKVQIRDMLQDRLQRRRDFRGWIIHSNFERYLITEPQTVAGPFADVLVALGGTLPQ